LFGIILDRTNFYAEAGGQEHDTGSIVIDNASNGEVAEFEVSGVQAFSGYILHIGKLKSGKFEVGDQVTSTYDEVSPINLSNTTPGLTKSSASPVADSE
jgi:alanyl-tRNA synthetase